MYVYVCVYANRVSLLPHLIPNKNNTKNVILFNKGSDINHLSDGEPKNNAIINSTGKNNPNKIIFANGSALV